MAHWLLQCNPKRWRVFDWWQAGETDLDSWTVTNRLDQVTKGDDFALWISGRDAGVYAIGTIIQAPHLVEGAADPYWVDPLVGPSHAVGLEVGRYFFDSPIRKEVLASDAGFSDALILRMPRTSNPIPMSAQQWSTLLRHAGERDGDAASPPERHVGQVVVMERGLGDTVEESFSRTPPREHTRRHREARLVKRYESLLGRPLQVRWARLGDGTRIVADAYDPETNTLIEAKASVSRQDVRMGIGQLFDYRRHLAPDATLALLVPAAPPADLQQLLDELGVALIVESG